VSLRGSFAVKTQYIVRFSFIDAPHEMRAFLGLLLAVVVAFAAAKEDLPAVSLRTQFRRGECDAHDGSLPTVCSVDVSNFSYYCRMQACVWA
jgi:hypothetical protein